MAKAGSQHNMVKIRLPAKPITVNRLSSSATRPQCARTTLYPYLEAAFVRTPSVVFITSYVQNAMATPGTTL
jgi:hypothetical protein